jgi:hypothetical protein
MPKVTGFTGNAPVGGGKKGLKTTNNSDSPGEVTGTDLSDGLPVAVTVPRIATLRWDGELKFEGGKFKCNLKCTNTGKFPHKTEDTEDVSVTAGTSLPFVTPVNVGP